MKDIQSLIQGVRGCACGKTHNCPIEAVVIREHALDALPALCATCARILLVADENTWAACGKAAAEQVRERLQKALVLADSRAVVIPNEARIAEIERALQPDTDLIIGVGSGVINDLCKHVSFRHGLPYFIIATAPSMDGYASVGAALILNGMKETLNARPPRAILADTKVLAAAPADMIRSGWGDIIGKYSCLNDWRLSALINGEYFCRAVYDLVMETADEVRALAPEIRAGDAAAVGRLTEALVAVGIAMSYVGNSRPASGSEHHLSHFFEITGILDHTPYFPHGTDVLYASVVTARLRQRILQGTCHADGFDRARWEREIRRVYTSSAEEVIALQDRAGRYETDELPVIRAKWREIRQILADAPTPDDMLAMIADIGMDYHEFETLYGEAKIRDAIAYAKDLKDRYTVLWLYDRWFA